MHKSLGEIHMTKYDKYLTVHCIFWRWAVWLSMNVGVVPVSISKLYSPPTATQDPEQILLQSNLQSWCWLVNAQAFWKQGLRCRKQCWAMSWSEIFFKVWITKVCLNCLCFCFEIWDLLCERVYVTDPCAPGWSRCFWGLWGKAWESWKALKSSKTWRDVGRGESNTALSLCLLKGGDPGCSGVIADALSDVLYLDLCPVLLARASGLPPLDVFKMQTLQWDELYISLILGLSKNLQWWTAGVGWSPGNFVCTII